MNSLHLTGLSSSLLLFDQVSIFLTSCCIWLALPFGTVSEAVMSSTNFHIGESLIFKPLIINKKSQGTNLVPCGTPRGTWPHSE